MRPLNHKPPSLAKKTLLSFLRDDISEEVQGDLEELFYSDLEKSSPLQAKLNYWYQVLNYLRPFAIRNIKGIFSNTYFAPMLKHNLTISFRIFKRYKMSFLINMIGLTTGLTCAILIYLWVHDERQVDHYNDNNDRLYEVMQNVVSPNGIQTGTGTPGILAEALEKEMPEVQYASSVVPAEWFSDKGVITFKDTRLRASVQYVDTVFFKLFTCPFIFGDKSTALLNKNDIAISEKLADRLFQKGEDVLGKIVEWNEGQTSGLFKITGVFKETPANATNHYDLLINYDVFLDSHTRLREWGNSDPSTFVLLRKNADPNQLNLKIHDFIKTKYKDSNQKLFLQKYSDRYLNGHYENGKVEGGRIEYVRLFSIVAIIILIIACINFMNLATARASRRLKEIGVKKAIGAGRKTLILQYFEESMLLSAISMVIALVLVLLILPGFNEFTSKNLNLNITSVLPVLVEITLVTGILAGSYPALYLSGFRPIDVLKGKIHGTVSEFWARRGLVIFQFAVAVILIVAVVVIYKQINYVQSRNLGYNRDNIIHFELELQPDNNPDYFNNGGALEKQVEAFLNEARNVPGVLDVANYYHNLTGDYGSLRGIDWEPGDEDEKNAFNNLEVGYDFIRTFGITMKEGRTFSREYANDRSAVIFNESAIKLMGLKDPVGKTIRLWGKEKHIIGVTGDFNYESLYQKVKPCIIQLVPLGYKIAVKIKNGSEQETITGLTKLYHEFYPGLAFDYRFVDDDYQALYVSEKRISVLAQYFSLLAIIISSLGLFGLAAFTTERRVKEIGMRKIFGSGDWKIIFLLSGDFTFTVLAAIIIGLPISYIAVSSWLEIFAYKIKLEWWYFAGAGLITLLIAWSAVGIQTIRAARIELVQCLKDE